MADTFELKVVTVDKVFYQGQVTMVELTTTEGGMGVYPGHIPLTAVVAPGILRISEEHEKREAALISGFLEILPDRMTILADTVEWPADIDAARAEEARIRAERRLKEGGDEMDVVKVELSLKRALTRLAVHPIK